MTGHPARRFSNISFVIVSVAVVWGIATAWCGSWAEWVSYSLAIAAGVLLMANRPSQFVTPFGGMVLLGCIQALTRRTALETATVSEVVFWITMVCIFAVTKSYCVHNRSEEILGRIATLGVLYICAALVGAEISPGKLFGIGNTDYPNGVYGTILNRDQFSALCELLLPVIWLQGSRPGSTRWIWIGGAAIGVAAILLAGSRMGSVVLLLEAAWLMWMETERPTLRRFRPHLFVSGTLLILALSQTSIAHRYLSLDPLGLRRDMYVGGLQLFADFPVIGAGLGTWAWIYPRYAPADTGVAMLHAHSDWLEWAGDGGITALVLMAYFVRSISKNLVRQPAILGVLAVFVHALVDFPLHKPALAAAVMFVAGIASND